MPLNLHIISPSLPPQFDAIGHYTGLLAAELSPSVAVTILTVTGHQHNPIPGVTIEGIFSVNQPQSIQQLVPYAKQHQPDWLILQYNPFSYGRWGLNLHLPQVIKDIKRESPRTRFAFMCHETFVPASNWKFAVMTTWQRWQFKQLGRNADLICFSIEPWTAQFSRWFPQKKIIHLPVGSNMPLVPISRVEARARLQIAENDLVIGLFGTAHVSRMLDVVGKATERVTQAGIKAVMLYVGPHGSAVQQAVKAVPVLDQGALPAEEVSLCFAAMDVCLAPFSDGVSTRRGSMMTGLQHAVATIGTCGYSTDAMLKKVDGKAILLADVSRPDEFDKQVLRALQDKTLREHIGQEGQRLYQENFDWKSIIHQLLESLRSP